MLVVDLLILALDLLSLATEVFLNPKQLQAVSFEVCEVEIGVVEHLSLVMGN
jgi:hypothetical protein